MTQTELNTKIKITLDELHSDINSFVKENAKYKIGDVVKTSITPKGYFVINQVGYDKDRICYYGSKIKSTGEISFMDMDSNIGTPERLITKVSLIVKKEEISFISECKYFNEKIIIKL